MLYEDRLYGNIEIDEPVILELIACPTIQRLKGIDQGGYFEPHVPGCAHSRFEHSLGVYLLLKKFGATLEEQIAGLIHDASHAAFSHCIDYVLDAGSQKEHNHQDNIFADFIKQSEIPEILKKYNFSPDFIIDDANFPLKETKLPDLCADRIDYSLRGAIVFKEIEDGQYFLDNLETENNRWIFKDFASAKKYAELFWKLNSVYYAGLPTAAMMKTVGDCLRYALKQGYITENDLYTTDEEVLAKIKSHLSTDQKLELLFDKMNNKVGFKNDKDDYESRIFCKSRIVDPLCRHEGKIKRVSDIDSGWKEIVERESAPKEYHLKFDK
ncbi:MAG: HD domain-containing protein [Patescibacteria group bacterium]|jgi:hypothetical protein